MGSVGKLGSGAEFSPAIPRSMAWADLEFGGLWSNAELSRRSEAATGGWRTVHPPGFNRLPTTSRETVGWALFGVVIERLRWVDPRDAAALLSHAILREFERLAVL